MTKSQFFLVIFSANLTAMLKTALKWTWRIFKVLLIGIWSLYQIALGIVLVALVWGFMKVSDYLCWPQIRKLEHENPTNTAFIQAEKVSLQEAGIKNEINWSWISYDSIPQLVKDVAIVAEDSRFFTHQGFDLEQIEYALVANHQAGKKARGASTISQQLAKNLFLSGEKEMSRKIREALLTLLIEQSLSKERILELYLNVAQFDDGVFGVRAGALHHFNKDVTKLTPAEVLTLVCLLPSPTKWDPRAPRSAFLQHKALVTRNLTLYKGIRDKFDFTKSDWQQVVLDSLSAVLEQNRWSQLRSRPWNSRNDSSLTDDSDSTSSEEFLDSANQVEMIPKGEEQGTLRNPDPIQGLPIMKPNP